MDDFYDISDVLDFNLFASDDGSISEFEESIVDPKVDLETSYVTRSQHAWQQVPLPAEMNLCDTNILAGLDDETLLTMSPTLIAHVQRTEASDGLQVISPRTVTLGGIAARTAHESRTSDMFIVGSAASRNMDWPVVSEPVSPHLFWNEPIDAYPSEPSSRPKTVTSGILSTTAGIDDPITKAFLIGRALVDLQRRADVAGSADRLSELLAACWTVEPDAYTDMGEASLAPTGPLLRYAIRSDNVYPVVNAPIQARKCMSVGANTAGRHLYGEFSAIDWRRLRVLAESVFYQASRLEGWTMGDMVLFEPPGNPNASPLRPGILQMRPLPGSVWSFDPHSFRLDIEADVVDVPGVPVPDRVRAAVMSYHETARPIAQAAAAGVAVSFSTSLNMKVPNESREPLIAGYNKVVTANAAFASRGKTSVAAVRNFVYQCLAENPKLSAIRSLWMARYMHETVQALNLTHMLDVTTTKHMAARMADVTTDMRAKLGVEAGRRGSSLAEWWDDMRSQLPAPLSSMDEGSGSWAIAATHLMLHPPTNKWVSLTRAMAHSSHAALARAHLTDVRLPAKIGSEERTYEAARAVTRQLGNSYGAFYSAMYDVSCILSARLKRAGNKMGAAKLQLAGMMWDIRAKVASTVTLHTDDGTATAAGTISGQYATYHLTTAPHYAYNRWQKALNSSGVVPRNVKMMYPHHAQGVISRTFDGIELPLFAIPVGSGSRLMRYASKPDRLSDDITRTLNEIRDDVAAVVEYYDTEHLERWNPPAQVDDMQISPLEINLVSMRPSAGSFWALISEMDQMEAAEIVDTLTRSDAAVSAEIESGMYASLDELRDAVWGATQVEGAPQSREAVI